MKFIKTFESFTKNYLMDLERLANTLDMSYDDMFYKLEELGCLPEEIELMQVLPDRMILSIDKTNIPLTYMPSENGEIHVLFNVNGDLPQDICFGMTDDGGKTFIKVYRSMTDLKNDVNEIAFDSVVEKNKI